MKRVISVVVLCILVLGIMALTAGCGKSVTALEYGVTGYEYGLHGVTGYEYGVTGYEYSLPIGPTGPNR